MKNFSLGVSTLRLFLILDGCLFDGLSTGAVILCSSHLLILTSVVFLDVFRVLSIVLDPLLYVFFPVLQSSWIFLMVGFWVFSFDPLCAIFSWISIIFD